jgi:hypothetical protein
MDWANGLTGKSRARWFGLVFGLTLCAAESGCARMQSFRNGATPPMLGATSPKGASSKAEGRGDLYAERMSRSPKLSVALQAPVSVAPGRDASTLATAAPSTTHPALPGPVEATRAESTKTASSPAPAPALEEPDRRPAAVADASSKPTPASIVASSRAALDAMTSYQVQLNRQERVGRALLDPEDVLLSIRRKPVAVRLEWEDGPSKGREVIYAADVRDGMMQINTPGALVPRIAMPTDSPLVLKSSRHPITEAGFDNIVANLEKTIELADKGDLSRGRLTYAGLEAPGPIAKPCHKLARITPEGETWHVYIDPDTHLPTLVEATDLKGELLERYTFRDVRPDPAELASADAFDPDRRWGPAKGLFGRLARSKDAKTNENETTTQ